MILALFASLGAIAGVAQSMLLRASAGGRPHPLAGLARLLLVGAALTVAAARGCLLPATIGWVAAFSLTGLALAREGS
ncbi:MAG: hypothetical protein R3A51_19110 [Nannocystaceae bacterium]|nr:hypothetical protein [Myxococcales bacterium]